MNESQTNSDLFANLFDQFDQQSESFCESGITSSDSKSLNTIIILSEYYSQVSIL